MGTGKTRDLPAELERTRRRFERWRRTRKGRSRIPEPLWTSAVKAAGEYGVNKTAQALRLDYYALKKRVAKEAVDPQHIISARVGPPGAASVSRRSANEKTAASASRRSANEKAAANASRGVANEEAVATFVELASPVSASTRECILELEDPGGAKMRVHLKGVEAPDLAALSRCFWGVEPCHGELRGCGSLPRRT